MSYVLKAVIGAALFLGSVVLFNVELLKLLDVGTCASGGPYVSARPCPDGTGTSMLLLTASIFGGIIGATIFAMRGTPPGSDGASRRSGAWSTGLLAWTIFFAGTGAVSLYVGLFDDTLPDDSALGATIVGITFLVMGLPVLAFLLWQWFDNVRNPPPDARFQPSSEIPTVYSTASGATDPGWTTMMQQGSRAIPMPTPANATAPDSSDEELDTLVKLERLQKLRESGALTDAEFEAQKKRILG